MNEAENACDVRPNLPAETLYHAVYIPPEYRESPDGKGNSIERRHANYNRFSRTQVIAFVNANLVATNGGTVMKS